MRQQLFLIVVLAAGIATELTSAQEQKQPAKKEIIGTIERLDPRFDKLIPKDAQLEKIAEGFIWTEGATWYKPGKFLLFSDIPNNVVVKWEAGKGASEYLKPSGYTGMKPRGGKAGDEPGSNGLAVDSQGRLHLCEHGDRRVTRIEKDGKKTDAWPTRTWANASIAPTTWLSIPTAMCISPIHPTVWKKASSATWTSTAFFASAARTASYRLVSRSLNPNSIALSPDLKKLYLTNGNSWMVVPVNEDGSTGEGKVFVNPRQQWRLTSAMGGALDGMKCDADGNLFATGPGGICVMTPSASSRPLSHR